MAEEAPRDRVERIAERVEVPDRDDQHQADTRDDYRPVDPFRSFEGASGRRRKKCPICGNPSNAGSPTFRGRKEVTCDTCGQFQISDSGEAALKRLSSEDRRAKLDEARQLAGPREIPYLGSDLFR